MLLLRMDARVVFAHEIGRQTRYDRTTGTVVDISLYATGKSNHNHPIVEFVAEGEDFSFMSDAEAGTRTNTRRGRKWSSCTIRATPERTQKSWNSADKI